MSEQGHNSGGQQIRAFVERILRLKEEQDTLAADIREVYAEAKATGFDKTAMGQLVAYVRKKDKDGEKFEEQSAIFDLYLSAYEDAAPRTHTRARAHARVENIEEIPQPTSSPEAEAPEPESLTAEASAGVEPPPSAPAEEFEPPAFLRKEEPNERCMQPASCKFARHPQKVTCADCSTAWTIAQRKAGSGIPTPAQTARLA